MIFFIHDAHPKRKFDYKNDSNTLITKSQGRLMETMTLLPPKPTERCMFLELPAEIRVVIYEQAIEEYAAGHNFCCRMMIIASENTQAFALTQVNRMIRKETLPLVSKFVLFQIHASTDKSRARTRKWLQHVDEEILEGVFGIQFFPWGYSGATITILLDGWVRTVRAEYGRRSPRLTSVIEEMELQVEEQMEELETNRDERYKMTREVLQEILETVITLSRFYSILGEIKRIGRIKRRQKAKGLGIMTAGILN